MCFHEGIGQNVLYISRELVKEQSSLCKLFHTMVPLCGHRVINLAVSSW